MYAKALAYAGDRALIGVHHMEGHLFAPTLEDPDLAPPFVALLASGGHTLLVDVPAWGRYRVLGATRDDAAGEAFDKVATLLGLGYPGGPEIERIAATGGMADVNRVAQIQRFGDGKGVGRIVVDVVTVGDLARASVAAPVMGDDAIALRQEEKHLRVPVVGAERPAMVKYDGLGVLWAPVLVKDLNCVLGGDCAHRLGSSVLAMRAGWARRLGFCSECRP
jgi:hypothetical protein